MSQTISKPGDLTAAAAALEADLTAFESAVSDGARVHLNTRKGLERLGRDLARAADVHDRLQRRVAALGQKLQSAQERAMGAASTLFELGAELGRRQTPYADLLGSYEAIITDAVAVKDLASQEGPDALAQIRERLGALAERARTLSEEARAAGFRDLMEDASARHQQLVALANKMGAVQS